MELSARNQLSGRVSRIQKDGLMAEVTIDLGNSQSVVSVITSGSVNRLGLREGDQVRAVIKATEVLVAKE
jgi:molybdopterin-binding protein